MMERLTRPCEDTMGGEYIDYTAGTFMGIFPCCTLGKVVDRLAYYEDMEEQGRLVVLPCKVGDTVYDTYLGEVKVKTVVSIALLVSESVNCVTVSAANERGAITQLENWRFGKTVFLTREEAEQALKGGANK